MWQDILTVNLSEGYTDFIIPFSPLIFVGFKISKYKVGGEKR